MSIEAGSDMILVSHSLDKQKAAIKAAVKAVKEGRITDKRINQSVLRILKLKRKRIGLEGPPNDFQVFSEASTFLTIYDYSP